MQALYAASPKYDAITFEHVKAHAGHPWNELADSLASVAAASSRVDHEAMGEPSPVFAIEHSAGLYQGAQYPVANGQGWTLPPMKPATHLQAVVQATHPLAIQAHAGQGDGAQRRPSPVILTVATANVLTLDAGSKSGSPSADATSLPTGRMTILQQQAHEAQ
eukprot:7035538-Alexandrium_andersonii.AAC.1